MQKLTVSLFKETSLRTQGISILGARMPWEVFDNATLYANPEHTLSRGRPWSVKQSGAINRGDVPWITPRQRRRWWVFGGSISSRCSFSTVRPLKTPGPQIEQHITEEGALQCCTTGRHHCFSHSQQRVQLVITFIINRHETPTPSSSLPVLQLTFHCPAQSTVLRGFSLWQMSSSQPVYSEEPLTPLMPKPGLSNFEIYFLSALHIFISSRLLLPLRRGRGKHNSLSLRKNYSSLILSVERGTKKASVKQKVLMSLSATDSVPGWREWK